MDTTTTMMLAEQGDRRKTPEMREYRPMTHEEARLLSYGDHPHVRLNSGKVATVKVNGAVKTWKRDPGRFEIPTKYGMYEYATFVPQADGTVTAWGNPQAMLVVAV